MTGWLSDFSTPEEQSNINELGPAQTNTPLFKGTLSSVGSGVMRGGAGFARSVQLALSLPFLAQDYLWRLS